MGRREPYPGKATCDLRQRPLRLRLYPDPILKQRASPVTMFDHVLQDFFHVMKALN